MNFDQTCIAMRERSLLEFLDLALHVIRDHFRPLLVLWLLGTTPFMVVNWLAIGWMAADVHDAGRLVLFHLTMILLISNQAQVATTLMTDFLGQAMFSPRPSLADSIRLEFRTLCLFVWVHGLLRMVGPVVGLAFLLRDETPDESFTMLYVLLAIMAVVGLLVRCVRPFSSEILLLEKTPWRPRAANQISFSARSASLHKAASTELSGRFVLICGLAIPLTITFLGTLLLVDSWLNLFSTGSPLPLIIYGPLALWITAGVMAVARFLSYIDIRIRQEGWEVELRMRAEAIRLEKVPG